MVVHFMWAGFWGLVFGAVLWVTRLAGWSGFVGAIVYGYAIGAIMSAVVMPAVGLKPLWEMPGLTFFLLDHLAFGLPLAIWHSRSWRVLASARAVRCEDRPPN